MKNADTHLKSFSKPLWLCLVGALAYLSTACVPHSASPGLDQESIHVEELIIGLLFIAAVVGIIAKRLRLPYTVGLVLMGLALAFQGQLDLNITPNIILAILVPPLIFEAAYHLNLLELRRNLIQILILAVPGVLFTTLLVGWIVSRGTGMALPLALVFGALVSATDPVSVVALLRNMGVPKRLQVLLEGESLFNDGTAIVLYSLILTSVLAGAQSFSFFGGFLDFLVVSGGGLIIGLILGTVISQVISRVDDHLIETALTSVLAYGAYLIAEAAGVSGVLAVVAAGLVNGNIGPRGMSPTTRLVVFNFWEFAAFIANSFIFLLIGLRIDLHLLVANWQLILWAILGVLAARALTIYGMTWLNRGIPTRWRHVLFWGSLRGAISLALALSLPESLGNARQQIQAMAFGVVIFTLIIQGFTMGPLAKFLKLIKHDERKSEYERRHARAVASQVAYQHLDKMRNQGLISEHTWGILARPLRDHNHALVDSVREIMISDPNLQNDEIEAARMEYLKAQRNAITDLLKDGIISEASYAQLIGEVDSALAEDTSLWPEMVRQSGTGFRKINRLITAVVQEQDIDNAISVLGKLGFYTTRLPSSGGFLGRRNATLLIGLLQGQEEIVSQALYQSCRSRVEYVTLPLEGSPMPLSTPTPITVGGATIFAFDVERYEEI
jgi:CPA1 family monovalent cation:H+ antiporter